VKNIEIVVHTYAIEYPHFAKLLAYQLSSLALYPPMFCKVKVTVCWTSADVRVYEVMRWFMLNTEVHVVGKSLQLNDIGRRSIGRNKCALETKADIVWFADADYFFGEGCLDTLAGIDWSVDTSIVYPRHVRISKNFEIGDKQILQMDPIEVRNIDKSGFGRMTYHRAIGGIQIVKGDFARKHGYLNNRKKFQKPTDKPFADTIEDTPFRQHAEKYGKMEGIRLPNLFRIRHSESALTNHNVGLL